MTRRQELLFAWPLRWRLQGFFAAFSRISAATPDDLLNESQAHRRNAALRNFFSTLSVFNISPPPITSSMDQPCFCRSSSQTCAEAIRAKTLSCAWQNDAVPSRTVALRPSVPRAGPLLPMIDIFLLFDAEVTVTVALFSLRNPMRMCSMLSMLEWSYLFSE
jgi:hypothetical protein